MDSLWTEHGVLHYLTTTGTPMHHATWWAAIERGRAPEPINPGERMPMWDAVDVVYWQQQRLDTRTALVDAIDWQEIQDDRHGRETAIDRADVAHELWRSGQVDEPWWLPCCPACDHPRAVHHPGGCMANDGRSIRPCPCPPMTVIRLPRPAAQETPSEAASGPTQRHLRVVPPLPPKNLQAARIALRAAITAGRAYLDDGRGEAPPGATLIGWWPPRDDSRIWLHPAAAIEAIQHELPHAYTRRKLTNDLETAGLLTREGGNLPRRATPDGQRHRVWDVPAIWLQPAIGPRRHD